VFLAGIVVASVVVLFTLGLLAPRLSKKTQWKLDDKLVDAAGEARHVPGRAGSWLAKPFTSSKKATDKSSSAGRKTRFKLPF
jgi:hypothetical protein